jgi:microcompartment protein CcmL/EutN
MKALGMIEVYSFPIAVGVADAAAKAADIKVIAFDRNRPLDPKATPLVMIVKIEGNVSAVRAAVEAGVAFAKSRDQFIVSHIIPNPGEGVEKMAYLLDINRDKYNKTMPKSYLGLEDIKIAPHGAYGLIEVQGLVAAIEGLDTMLKTAEIQLVHTEKRLGGRLVTFIVTGSVSAVKSAIEAGKAAASVMGKIYGCEVIPSPHDEITKFFNRAEDK